MFYLICVLLSPCHPVLEEQPVKIRFTDVNDELPEFRNIPRPFLTTLSANAAAGTSVYQLMAEDVDQDSVVRYTLESGKSCSSTGIYFVLSSYSIAIVLLLN